MNQIRRFHTFNLLAYTFAWVPIVYPFFTLARGFSNRDYFALFSLYYFAMCLFEVPTGLAADRLGRKNALVVGSFGLAASYAVIFLARSFPAAASGLVLMALFHTMLSGSDAAWLYDRLLEENRSHEYMRLEGRAQWMRLLGVSATSVLAGAGAQFIGFGTAFALSIACSVAAGCLALTLAEPARSGAQSSVRVRLAGSARLMLTNRHVRWVFLYYILLFLLLRVAYHFYQPHMRAVGIENYLVYGVTLGLLNVFAAPFAGWAHRLEAWLGPRWLASSLPLMMSASFFLLNAFPVRISVVFFALQQVPFALINPVTRSYTQRHISSDRRATVFSMQSLAGRLAVGLVFLVTGEAFQRLGVSPLYLVLGLGSAALGLALHLARPANPA
ncbi:MAG: MFS transporter [Planctomycetota bacterium]